MTVDAPPAPVSLRQVTRRYGDLVALDGVDLEVGPGEVVGLLGSNGAGKSTLLQLLLGLRRPTSGEVRLYGGDPTRAASRRRVGSTLQETGLPPTLRVGEVVDLVARHHADPVPTAELLDGAGLGHLRRRQTGGLSGGQQRRLAVALAFVGRPGLVLLDEPTTGLDVDSRDATWAMVRAFAAGGGTVLLTSHHLGEVEALAGRVVVLQGGRVLVDDRLEAVRSRVALRQVTLRAPHLPDLPGLSAREVDGDRWHLLAADSDALVRALVTAQVPFSDLAVAPSSLEQAFRALTSPASAGGAEVAA